MFNLYISVFFIIARLIILLQFLNRFFFKPVGNIVDSREKKIQHESEDINTITEELEEKTSGLDLSLKNARRDSARLREELISRGEVSRSEMIEKTRLDSGRLFEQKMSSLDDEILKAEKKLETEIDIFKTKIEALFI